MPTLTFKIAQRVEPGTGAGDVVERALRAVGIHQAVKQVEEALGVHCGCGNRREILNRMLKKWGKV